MNRQVNASKNKEGQSFKLSQTHRKGNNNYSQNRMLSEIDKLKKELKDIKGCQNKKSNANRKNKISSRENRASRSRRRCEYCQELNNRSHSSNHSSVSSRNQHHRSTEKQRTAEQQRTAEKQHQRTIESISQPQNLDMSLTLNEIQGYPREQQLKLQIQLNRLRKELKAASKSKSPKQHTIIAIVNQVNNLLNLINLYNHQRQLHLSELNQQLESALSHEPQQLYTELQVHSKLKSQKRENRQLTKEMKELEYRVSLNYDLSQQYKEMIQQLKSQQKLSQIQIQSLCDNNKQLRELSRKQELEFQQLKKDNNQLEKQVEKMDQKLSMIAEDINILEIELEKERGNKRAAQQSNRVRQADLQHQIAQINAEKKALVEKVTTIVGQLRFTKSQLSQLSAELLKQNSATQQHHQSIKQHEYQSSEWQRENEELRSQCRQQREEIGLLYEQVEEMKGICEKYKDKYLKLKIERNAGYEIMEDKGQMLQEIHGMIRGHRDQLMGEETQAVGH